MGNMEHIDSMTVIGTRLPVVDNPNLYFGEGCYGGCDNITDIYGTNDFSE